MNEEKQDNKMKHRGRVAENGDVPFKIYPLGMIGLVVMAFVGFWLISEAFDSSGAGKNLLDALSFFGVILWGGPFWLGIGIACLVAAGKSNSSYRSDLIMLGVANITGILVTALTSLFYGVMLVVLLTYYGVIFGFLITRETQRRKKRQHDNFLKHKGDDAFYFMDSERDLDDEGRKKRAMRKVMPWVIIVILSVVFLVGVAWRVYDSSDGASMVRRDWQKTALANTTMYVVEEDENLATTDKIYLKIDDVDAEVVYYCDKRGGNTCYYVYSPALSSGQNSLGAYFWQKNQNAINQILVKYDGKLKQWTNVQIYVYDRSVIKDFIAEVLEIPDIQRLYKAYKETKTQVGETNARAEFGDFFLDVRDGGREERLVLFEEVEKLGL